MPNGLKIKASKLRGVESQGMLCSANELGIAEDTIVLYGTDNGWVGDEVQLIIELEGIRQG